MLKKLIICVAIPLGVGLLASFLTGSAVSGYEGGFKSPDFAPPGFVFPLVWTILYILMGLASYLVLTAYRVPAEQKREALYFYGVQLFFNFMWSIFFFNLKLYLFSFIWLVCMWIFIFVTAKLFYKISKLAAYFLVPYLAWVAFAGYLNFAIYVLN